MDAMYVLIPLSVAIVLGVAALLAWMVMAGQFDDLDAEGRRVIEDDVARADEDHP